MDHQLFAKIYEAHARAVYAHAVRMTGDFAGAEDIVSLTFLEAWRLRDTLEGVISQRAWLFGVATNVMRNSRRAARRHSRAIARLPPPGIVPDLADAVVSRIADTAQAAAALAALKRLRSVDREVLLLCVWSGLSQEEVAQVCSVPVGTVRSRLSRARGRLRKLAAAHLPEPAAPRRTPATRTAREGDL
ncbi:RNA polymerase sigma factor [Streptomyces sp. G-G2]|uniref:RNA polymerase sigma factor n=1 Tax=Streptomyces sp. G-G2 TaxID=3046201 RepID=UPI0024B9D5FA|nr:RNA polymerase sigma factor [Streptomyces sp. G-G2]MDJ0383509.1 RNA polymerase sigma factor [Streptomyces sp. G-G2]